MTDSRFDNIGHPLLEFIVYAWAMRKSTEETFLYVSMQFGGASPSFFLVDE